MGPHSVRPFYFLQSLVEKFVFDTTLRLRAKSAKETPLPITVGGFYYLSVVYFFCSISPSL